MKFKLLLQLFLVISISICVSCQLAFAQGDDVQMGCCMKTNAGDSCLYVGAGECESGFVPARCEGLPECRVGVCEYENQGCFPNVAKTKCISDGGKFLGEGDISGYSQCSLGCCVLGTQCSPSSEQECRKIFSNYPELKMNFVSSVGEKECIDVCRAKELGCCVLGDGCSSLSYEECGSLGGEFNPGKCSEVCEACKGEKKLGCSKKDRYVHWYDSCGNYGGVEKECAGGDICAEKDGAVGCHSMSCENTWDNPAVDVEDDGGSRLNGESWCEYDSNIGPGIDLPGSEHYVHSCINGVEMVERCQKTSARDQICLEGKNVEGFNEARCVAANQDKCLSCKDERCCKSGMGFCIWVGSGEGDKEKAEVYADSVKKNIESKGNAENPVSASIDVGSTDNTNGFCLPFVSKGFAPKIGDDERNKVCGGGDIKDDKALTPYWTYSPWEGSWDCDANCIGYTPEYAVMTNQFCGALGDCGAKYNLLGEWEKDSFKRDCDFGAGEGKSIKDDSEDIGDVVLIGGDDKLNDGKPLIEGYNCGIDCGGDMANKLVSSCEERISDPGTFEEIYKTYRGDFKLDDLFREAGTDWSKWGGVIGGIGAGVGAVSLFITIGAIASNVAWKTSFLAGLFFGGGFFWLPLIGWVLAVATALYLGITLGLSDDYTAHTNVDCGVWEAPLGDENCEKCHSPDAFGADGLHECSEYKCKSLGQGCEYVDTVEGYKCLSGSCDKGNIHAPDIRPMDKMKLECSSGNCDIAESESGYVINGKLNPLKKQVLGVKTLEKGSYKDSYATCVFSDSRDVDEKGNLVGTEITRSKSTVHNITLNPFLDAGTHFIYVQCNDICDNKNRALYEVQYEVDAQQDISPPLIEKFEPESGSKVAASVEKQEVVLTMSEKSKECRWSNIDEPYEGVKNVFSCPGEGMMCKGLVNVSAKDNVYYFRCKDKQDNINRQSTIYSLAKSEPLLMSSVYGVDGFGKKYDFLDSEHDKIMGKNFTLNVLTSGGADSGKSKCSVYGAYSFELPGEDASHSIDLGPFNTGNYEFGISCSDSVGNVNETSAKFEMFVDTEPPKITKVYEENGVLTLKTDKESKCYYGNDTEFSATGGLKHSVAIGDESYFEVWCESTLFGVRGESIDIFIV